MCWSGLDQLMVDVHGVAIDFARCVLVGSSSNADVDFRRWYISAYPAVARDQVLRVISCWYVSCDDQQRALRDFEATTFCVQEPAVGFTSDVERSHALRLLVCESAVGSEVTCSSAMSFGFLGFAAGRGYDQAGGASGAARALSCSKLILLAELIFRELIRSKLNYPKMVSFSDLIRSFELINSSKLI
ncbi:DEAD-box ATP-dependent RNA helicase 16 [Dorcoceras hygrometricum]|uniref:DEAD-box ATP-dependent RNA helicase 16 n=1 Tax=Dorcoceras hygrometricum TaxID=472368 RepID=A0A2Z7B899_9LAMI|nr:DEAD-box ATP-dependent RNA helicase 16 [Dorcoceras hygrometricum]